MAKKLLVAGSSCIDFLLNTTYIPAPGETLVSQGSYAFTPGGRGANAALAACALGAEVALCSRVGDDTYGDRMLKLYSDSGIDTRNVKVDKLEQTGLAVVMLEKNGVNRRILFSGANRKICESDIDSAMEVCYDGVLTSLELGEDAVVSAAKHCAYEGTPLFLDGCTDKDFPLERLDAVEILSPNEAETEILTGIRPNNLENCLRASIALCNRVKAKYIVLKLGNRGCYVYDGKYCDIISPFDVGIVDRTAAGDVFTAALTVEYLRTGDILAAAKLANAAGALTVSKLGSALSVPTLEEVEALINE